MIAYLAADSIAKGHRVGIFFPTYVDLENIWEHILDLFHIAVEKKNIQHKRIHFKSGSVFDFWSMDRPDSGRGNAYHRVIIDEAAKAKKFKQAYQQTIMPTLADFKGDLWIFSTPKGKLHYFYQLQEEKRNTENWVVWHFSSYDNPHLDKAEIDNAKKELDPVSFQQEYLALDVDATQKPFLYTFNEKVIGGKFHADLPIWLSFDFNINPCTCIVAQRIGKQMHVVDLIEIQDGSTPEMCDKIKSLYPKHYRSATITGDATGRARSALVRGNVSHWLIIQNQLGIPEARIKVRKQNVSHENSAIICNSAITQDLIRISPKCKKLIVECELAQVEPSNNGIKLVKTADFGLHFFDCFRYLIDAAYPKLLLN